MAFGNPEIKRLQQEIESMQFKKQSLISTVQGEIQAAKQKISNVMFMIGQDVYASHINGVEIDDKLKAYFKEIETLNSLMAEKEEKITDIAKRYDDELSMLSVHLNSIQPPPPPTNIPVQTAPMHGNAQMAGAGAFCTNCGKPYIPGQNAFCIECGAKI